LWELKNSGDSFVARVPAGEVGQAPKTEGEVHTGLRHHRQQVLQQGFVLFALGPKAKLASHALLVGTQEQIGKRIDAILRQRYGLLRDFMQQR